jgi:hypothetical protein
MRRTLLAGAMALAAIPPVHATAANDAAVLTAQHDAIARLSWMNGQWTGEAVTQTPQGEHRVRQTERIGDLLDGTIKLVEGRGFDASGRKTFHAFGVVSFDAASGHFRFHSYAQGHSGDFAFEPTADGYVWEIPAGPATIRYTARLVDGRWHEVGERIVANQPPMRFFEMNLQRVSASNWPEAGAMTP